MSEPSFEDLYRELEETVRKLEAGDLSLADSLLLFERSTKLAEQCNALLDGAELKVRQLTAQPDAADHSPRQEAQPFDGWMSSS